MENKQTAVDWLIKIYLQKGKIDSFDIEQAKELEKQQIIDARLSLDSSDNVWDKEIALELTEQYYNETYGE